MPTIEKLLSEIEDRACTETADIHENTEHLIAALRRVMAEVKVNTDIPFYDHCCEKVVSILSGEKECIR